MSPLAKEIIDKLNSEQDTAVLAEVLDFYEYIKQKNIKNYKKNGLKFMKMNQQKMK